VLRYDAVENRSIVDAAQASGEWFSAKLAGDAIWNETKGDVSLSGQTNIRLRELSARLTSLAGTTVQLNGYHQAPLELHVQRTENGAVKLTVDGKIGWESGEVAGASFGPATVPVRLTKTSLTFAKSVVPVGEGRIFLAGQLQYQPGPAMIHLKPGVFAESIQLTEEMSDGWLKFVAPPVHRVEQISGTFGAELDEATIVLGSRDQSRVAGRLNIERADMSLTPMTRELIRSLGKIQSRLLGQSASRQELRGQITVPSQVVDFDLDLGVVNHGKVLFDFDKTRMATSGSVTLDGKLAIIAEMPLDYVGIGGATGNRPGKAISVPVTGSFYQPRVDPAGIGGVVTVMSRTTRNAREKISEYAARRSTTFPEEIGAAAQRTENLLDASDQIANRLKRALEESRSRRRDR